MAQKSLLEHIKITNTITISRCSIKDCECDKCAALEKDFEQYRQNSQHSKENIFLDVITIVPDCEQGFYTDIMFEDNIWYIHPKNNVMCFGFENFFGLGCSCKNWRDDIWVEIPNNTLC